MNCIIIDDDRLSRKVIEEFISKTEGLKLIGSYSNAIDAINAFRSKEEIHLVFLDIEMPEMSGLEFLKNIHYSPQTIIISAKDKYALDAFEYDVDDYLLKPITYARFYKAIDKAITRYNERKELADSKDEIFIKRTSSLIKLKYDDILWIEALENYVTIYTFSDKFTIHFTLKSIEKKLPHQKFRRIHRSHIINIDKINIIEDNCIIIQIEEGKKMVPIGKSYKEKLLNDLNIIIK
ncbi:MAG: response regulator transcription factor [Bacteroidia bacterium]|nr:response regulator transcription factor [Bacteroidia bacterium]